MAKDVGEPGGVYRAGRERLTKDVREPGVDPELAEELNQPRSAFPEARRRSTAKELPQPRSAFPRTALHAPAPARGRTCRAPRAARASAGSARSPPPSRPPGIRRARRGPPRRPRRGWGSGRRPRRRSGCAARPRWNSPPCSRSPSPDPQKSDAASSGPASSLHSRFPRCLIVLACATL